MDADVARALERLPGDHRAFLLDFLRLADDRPDEEQPSAAPMPAAGPPAPTAEA
jgi:hypothetical protein